MQTHIELRKPEERVMLTPQVTKQVKPEDRVFVYSDSEIVVHYSAEKRKFESIVADGWVARSTRLKA